MLSYKDVEKPYFVSAKAAGVDQDCVAFTMKTTASSDRSISAGSLGWSLCFKHTKNGWRLYDQGQG